MESLQIFAVLRIKDNKNKNIIDKRNKLLKNK